MLRSFLVLSLLNIANAKHAWVPIESSQFDDISECFSIAFAPDGETGWAGIGSNSEGSQIWKTTAGGSNWTVVWPDPDTKETFNLFLGGAAKSTEEALITGLVAQTYTTDGTKFQESVQDVFSPAQDAEVLPNGLYGIATQGLHFNGVATSESGAKWQNIDIGANGTIYRSRYSAYPTEKTFYVTAGVFPTATPSQSESEVHQQFQRVGRNVTSMKSVFTFHDDRVTVDPVNCSQDASNCFSAGVFKTADGGVSWKQVYDNTNTGQNVYPNDIDCIDALNCVAVLEGASCHILVTNDGWATWNETHTDFDPACSLMYVDYVSAEEVWVAGGHLARLDFEGHFWHSTDAGKSWALESQKNLWIIDLEVTSNYGYALAEDQSSGATLLKYTA